MNLTLKYLLSDTSVAAALIGAIVGAVVTQFLHDVVATRRQRKEHRLALAESMSTFFHEYYAEMETAIAERGRNESLRLSPTLTRLDGRAMELQLRVWRIFPERRVRAAFAKLVNRFDASRRLVLAEKTPAREHCELALQWMEEQYLELWELMTAIAGIPTCDPGRVTFVGFRAATYEDKRLLSIEDTPPPWEFGMDFTDVERKLANEEKQQATKDLKRLVGDMTCPIHNRPAHIRVLRDMTLSAAVCCESFHMAVNKVMGTRMKIQYLGEQDIKHHS